LGEKISPSTKEKKNKKTLGPFRKDNLVPKGARNGTVLKKGRAKRSGEKRRETPKRGEKQKAEVEGGLGRGLGERLQKETKTSKLK